MKKLLRSASFLACGCGLVFVPFAVNAASAAPPLTVQVLDRQTVQITWPGSSVGLLLEQTSGIGAAADWQAVKVSPALKDNQFTISLPILTSPQFFRLRRPLTSIK